MTTRPKTPRPSVQKVPAERQIPTVSELPVTRAMLLGVRDELAARLDQHTAQFAEVHARFDRVDARLDQHTARFAEVDARFEQVDARFEQVDARFEQVDARFKQIDARFDRVDAEFRELRADMAALRQEMVAFKAEVRADLARIKTIVEEQDARNRIVMEVVQGHNARFDRMEADIAASREMFREIMAAVVKPATS
ncbi:MAG: hypothetical protein U0326_38935 [Polyangiales bacterium]